LRAGATLLIANHFRLLSWDRDLEDFEVILIIEPERPLATLKLQRELRQLTV
jgi:hypothetical protein